MLQLSGQLELLKVIYAKTASLDIHTLIYAQVLRLAFRTLAANVSAVAPIRSPNHMVSHGTSDLVITG